MIDGPSVAVRLTEADLETLQTAIETSGERDPNWTSHGLSELMALWARLRAIQAAAFGVK